MLIANGFVKTQDEVIADYPTVYSSKMQFYADTMLKASSLFEKIQNHL
jgi:hypothetical protein